MLLIISACNLAVLPTATQDSRAVDTLVAQTVQASSLEATLQAQNTLISTLSTSAPAPAPASPTFTLPALPSATAVLLPTATFTPLPSPLPATGAPATAAPTAGITLVGAPSITATVDTNCRSGPNSAYARIGYLLVGQVSTVAGRNSSSTWWVIANLNRPGEFCWVWGETTVVTGDTSTLPVITPPPLPEFSYRVGLANRHECDGVQFFSFKVVNTGELPIRSARIKIFNKETDKGYGPDSFNYPFQTNANACKTGKYALGPGEIGYLVTDLGHQIHHGTAVRAVILLCSQEALQGSCDETRIDFTAP
jgi:hypothetical protein